MTPSNIFRLILLAAIWGGSFLFMRVAAPVLGALPTAFGRVALAALGLAALIGAMRVSCAFRGRFGATLMLGAINSAIPFLMFALAARVLPAGYSAILNATAPLMGVAVGFIGFHERITWTRFAGMTIGLAGVAVLTGSGPVEATGPVLAGIAACLLATTCYAIASFLTRRWITERGGLDSRIVAFGSQIGAVIALAPFALWSLASQPLPLRDIGANVWLSMAALGLLCTSIAYILFFKLIAEAGPVKALSVTFLIPLFGVLWGWLALGETATPAHAVGGGLIGIALWLVLRSDAAAQRKR